MSAKSDEPSSGLGLAGVVTAAPTIVAASVFAVGFAGVATAQTAEELYNRFAGRAISPAEAAGA